MTGRGYTLVELLVALVLLQVGILATVGTLVLASRFLTRAELLEWGTAEVQRVLDSLAATSSSPGQAETPSGPGTLRWWLAADGAVRVEYVVADTALVSVEGRLGEATAPGA